jgi:hypothetical protein
MWGGTYVACAVLLVYDMLSVYDVLYLRELRAPRLHYSFTHIHCRFSHFFGGRGLYRQAFAHTQQYIQFLKNVSNFHNCQVTTPCFTFCCVCFVLCVPLEVSTPTY